MVNSASWKSAATWRPVVAQISKETVTKTVTTSCGYSCAAGAMQKVKSMGISKEADQKHCSMKCCMTKGCVAFNYDSKSKACLLSGSPFAKSRPVAGPKTMMTCQKASGDAPEVEYSNAVEDVLAD